MKTKSGKRRGFTLIELLVVISIIALLISILMPALSKAREQAKAAICMTQLKQWGLCFAMYMDDNDEKFALGRKGTWISWFAWIDMLNPYYDNEEILFCPSAPNTGTYDNSGADRRVGTTRISWFARGSGTVTDPQYSGSYGINYWVSSIEGGDSGGYQEDFHWKSGYIKSSGSVPIILDCMWIGGYPYDTDLPSNFEDSPNQFGQLSRFCIKRHQNDVNCVFMDQSVRKVYIKELWGLKWHRQFNTRNLQTQSNAWWPDWIEM